MCDWMYRDGVSGSMESSLKWIDNQIPDSCIFQRKEVLQWNNVVIHCCTYTEFPIILNYIEQRDLK